ncbi:MAG: ABC transporter permease [Coriobacteriales bacterium]|nr:ABC transporter permease [Coriobacteriales bacterium]
MSARSGKDVRPDQPVQAAGSTGAAAGRQLEQPERAERPKRPKRPKRPEQFEHVERADQMNMLQRVLYYQRTQPLLTALIALFLSMVAISLIMVLMGKNPLVVYTSLLQGSGWLPKPQYATGKSMLSDFLGMLDALTPMLFAALAVAIAFKAGLFNIGVSGQMLAAGFITTVVLGYSPLGAALAKPLVLLMGLVIGAGLGAFVGVLKARFNIHEVVSTIMLNYIIQYIVSFFINSYYVDPVSRQSRVITSDARLTLINVVIGDIKTRIPLCFVLAILVAVGLYFVLMRTRLGFEIRTVGANRKAAQYFGIKPTRTIVIAMMLSGGCAGLAGVTYYLGYFNCINPGTLTSVGFDSIAVALLGNCNPLACIFASLLITTMTYGSIYLKSAIGLGTMADYFASLIVAIVLLFSSCSAFIRYLIDRRRFKYEEAGENVAVLIRAAAGGADSGGGSDVTDDVAGGVAGAIGEHDSIGLDGTVARHGASGSGSGSGGGGSGGRGGGNLAGGGDGT